MGNTETLKLTIDDIYKMNDTKISEITIEDICQMGACFEGVEFVKSHENLKTAWEVCNKGCWMMWVLVNFPNREYLQAYYELTKGLLTLSDSTDAPSDYQLHHKDFIERLNRYDNFPPTIPEQDISAWRLTGILRSAHYHSWDVLRFKAHYHQMLSTEIRRYFPEVPKRRI